MEIPIIRSRSGIPCMWENGGGCTNTGYAEIITDADGYPKPAIFVSKYGDLCNGNHALIKIRPGDKIVFAKIHRDKTLIGVFDIQSINGDKAEIEVCTDPIAEAALMAAVRKARDYHCRRPHYIWEGNDNE